MHRRVFTVSILFTLAALAAFAEEFKIKPGLWESTSKTQTSAPSLPPDALAKMTPAQRAQAQAMMALRFDRDEEPTTEKSCLTPELIAEVQTFIQKDKDGCEVKASSFSPTKLTIQIDCRNNGMTSVGTMAVEAPDPTHYFSNLELKIVTNDRPIEIKQKVSAKWLGADCGSVKPDLPMSRQK